MTLPNIFSKEVANAVIGRINQLTPETQPKWGKMTVDQMLAHCSVTYEMVYDDKHPKPNPFMHIILKTIVKNYVTGQKPYKHSTKTAPAFLITERKNFEEEKARLIAYIEKTEDLGEDYFDGKESLSFGKLTKDQWNTMFYKHLNHHLSQFGV